VFARKHRLAAAASPEVGVLDASQLASLLMMILPAARTYLTKWVRAGNPAGDRLNLPYSSNFPVQFIRLVTSIYL
jgi:hypothetical protein